MNTCPRCKQPIDLAARQTLGHALRRRYRCEHCGAKIRYHWFPDAIFGFSLGYLLVPIYVESKRGFDALVIVLFVVAFALTLLQMWLARRLRDKMARTDG